MIIRPDEILAITNRRDDVGVTSGCFDLLHFYHLEYLRRCKERCGFLIVGVDSDSLVVRNKGKRPHIHEFQRAVMVEAIRFVDAVFVMSNMTDFEIACSRAQFFFKHSGEIYGKPVPSEIGGAQLVIVPDIEEATSTSAITARIRKAA